MMEDWKDSPGHRRNMLTPDITEIGVGARTGQIGPLVFRAGVRASAAAAQADDARRIGLRRRAATCYRSVMSDARGVDCIR